MHILIGQASFSTIFRGEKEFLTAKEVKNIAVQCEILSRTPAILEMIIYKYNNAFMIKKINLNSNQSGDDGIADLNYTTIFQ